MKVPPGVQKLSHLISQGGRQALVQHGSGGVGREGVGVVDAPGSAALRSARPLIQ